MPYAWTPANDEDHKAYVNVDHGFELKFLKEFIVYMMNELERGSPECQKFQAFWLKDNPASKRENWGDNTETDLYRKLGRGPYTRLDTMVKLLASDFPPFADFVGCDLIVNAWKGRLFDKGLGNIQTHYMNGHETDGQSFWIDWLNHMAVAMELANHEDTIERFRRTYTRLRLAFRKLSSATCSPPENYERKFEVWLTDRLESQRQEIEGLYRRVVRIYVKPDELGVQDKGKYQVLITAYPETHYTLQTGRYLALIDDPIQHVNIGKRQDSRDLCTVEPLSTTLSASSAIATLSTFSSATPSPPPSPTTPTSSPPSPATPTPTYTCNWDLGWRNVPPECWRICVDLQDALWPCEQLRRLRALAGY